MALAVRARRLSSHFRPNSHGFLFDHQDFSETGLGFGYVLSLGKKT